MIILKLILCFVVLLVIPVLLGLLFTKFMKEKNNILWAFIIGYLFEFASFEILYLPMYFAECSFKTLHYVWCIIILITTIASIVVNRNRFKEILVTNIQLAKNMPSLIIIFGILLLIQIYVPVRYMHIDLDDAFYVANTAVTLETNTLFKIIPYTGNLYKSHQIRYCLSGLTIYYASLSEILNIQPAILQHTIWPAIAVLVEVSVNVLIGNRLFKRDKEKLSYFLIFLSIIYIYGFISLYTNFSFFAYRSWQGKALIANLIIPAVWLCYMYCMENSNKIIYWLMFLLIMISACFMSETGVFLIPIEVGGLSLITLIQNRKILNFLKLIACCLPQFIVGTIYIILK